MPLPNGSPTAAELDRAIAAEAAYNAALADGASEGGALAAAKQAINDKAYEQFLRQIGVQ